MSPQRKQGSSLACAAGSRRIDMDAALAPQVVKINRLLPYWAVFQADIRQTLRSWIYQAWMFLTLAAAAGSC